MREVSEEMTRRAFHRALLGGVLVGGTTLAAEAQQATPPPITPPEEPRDYPAPKFKPNLKKPRLGGTLVQDFVIFAHSELDMVKLLLDKQPALLNATVDWGGGDFETGLGGASHMGRRDIAEFLLSKGARIDIFAATMLGHLDVVKSLLTLHPNLIDAKGPHGIPLIVHAQMGVKNDVKEAAAVLAYLEGLKKP